MNNFASEAWAWIVENKEWLFQGIGLSIILAIAAIVVAALKAVGRHIAKAWNRSQAKPKTQKVDRVSLISPSRDEIETVAKTRPGMNWDEISARWTDLQRQAREKWESQPDGERDSVDGNRDRLAGKIQEKYGWTKDEAEVQFDAFAEAFDDSQLSTKVDPMAQPEALKKGFFFSKAQFRFGLAGWLLAAAAVNLLITVLVWISG